MVMFADKKRFFSQLLTRRKTTLILRYLFRSCGVIPAVVNCCSLPNRTLFLLKTNEFCLEQILAGTMDRKTSTTSTTTTTTSTTTTTTTTTARPQLMDYDIGGVGLDEGDPDDGKCTSSKTELINPFLVSK